MPGTLDALVMTLFEESNGPLTAYELVRRSRAHGSPLAPNQAYRVLHRLVSANRLQRIELLSAYVPLRGERLGFIICRSCCALQTFPISRLLSLACGLCENADFRLSSPVFEVSGLCADCAGKGAPGSSSTDSSEEARLQPKPGSRDGAKD